MQFYCDIVEHLLIPLIKDEPTTFAKLASSNKSLCNRYAPKAQFYSNLVERFVPILKEESTTCVKLASCNKFRCNTYTMQIRCHLNFVRCKLSSFTMRNVIGNIPIKINIEKKR